LTPAHCISVSTLFEKQKSPKAITTRTNLNEIALFLSADSGKKWRILGCNNLAQDIVGDRFNDVPENAVVITFCLTRTGS
jgi:hypothetical protein